MPANSYGRMELMRLSPNTGKALTRLNVIAGQILYGKVYKMEAFTPGQQAASSGADPESAAKLLTAGGIAKIALGALLIEAIVSQPLPEGSSVKFEVIKLGEETFTLKLLEINGEPVGRSEPAKVSQGPDQAEWSSYVRDRIAGEGVEIGPRTNNINNKPNQAASRIDDNIDFVKAPDLSGLPKSLVQAIRGAIIEEFINPADFTVNYDKVRSDLNELVGNAQGNIFKFMFHQSGKFSDLAKSFFEVTGQLVEAIKVLPAENINPAASPGTISSALNKLTPALQAYMPEIAAEVSDQDETQVRTVTARSDEQAISKPGTDGASTHPAKSGAEILQSPKAGVPLPGTISQAPLLVKPGVISQPLTFSQEPASGPAGTPSKLEILNAVFSTPKPRFPNAAYVISKALDNIHEAEILRAADTRSILFGMRVLVKLSEQMMKMKGISIEDSESIGVYSTRLSQVSNALEGAMVAPLLTHIADSPDLVARLLLSFLFPGGSGELGIFQPMTWDGGGHGRDSEGNDTQKHGTVPTIGIIRLSTEGLGDVGVRLEYTESGEKIDGRLGGRFTANVESSKEIINGIPSLEAALDARGIKSGGFRVTEINPSSSENANGKTLRLKGGKKPKSKGLDIKA